jgi:hypothetical protein
LIGQITHALPVVSYSTRSLNGSQGFSDKIEALAGSWHQLTTTFAGARIDDKPHSPFFV